MIHEEADEQIKVSEYLRWAYPKVLFTISIAGVKMIGNKVQQIVALARLKRMGYKKGTSDIIIFESRNGANGLLIEMKSPGNRGSKGRISIEEKEFLQLAEDRGYAIAVCWGFDEAKIVIDNYFAVEEKSIGEKK